MNNLRWSKAPYYLLLPVMAALLAGCGKKPVAEPPVRAVRTLVLAETGGVLEREFAAEIRARTESRLGFRVGGKVNRRLVELGQSVTRGQVLAQLDPQDLQLGQEAARAGLAAAEAQARAEAQAKPAAMFKDLAEQPAHAGAPRDLDFIMDIPVQLTVELGRTKITIKDLLQLAQGSVIELDALAGDPMDVLVNGCLIAQGEVVVVNDKFGIRLTDITSAAERIRKLKR